MGVSYDRDVSPDAAGGADRLLQSLGADLPRALEAIELPLYVVDRNGVIRWLNHAAVDVIGDAVGLRFVEVLAPEAARRARQEFSAKLLGTKKSSRFPLVLLGPGGATFRYEVASVPLVQGERVVGIFGIAFPGGPEPIAAEPPEQLTPRQREVLQLLSLGRSTREIASELGIAEETARNHIRHLLRRLGARSRLGAVAEARRLGLHD